MKYKTFDTIYVNGCSHTAGGGLYEEKLIEFYKKNFNIEWSNERDVNFPKYLGDYFDVKLVDESKCGSGAPRLVRTTFEHIFKIGLEQAKKTLFIFQINTPVHRLEFYCNEIDDYLIVNVQYKSDGSFEYVTAVDSHSPNEWVKHPSFYKEKISKDIEKFISEYHDPFKYLQKIHSEIAGLFSYLELNNIEYFFGFDTGDCFRPVNNKRRIDILGNQTISEFSWSIESTIMHETKGFSQDGHPGYFCHKLFSEKLVEFLEEKLKPTLWVFGDSFSSPSVPDYDSTHHLYNNDFRVKYSKFKGYYPKHFPEIISEKLNFNIINLAVPSSSNEQILQSYLENIEKIKPNDILFFGWTYVSRYNLANRENKLENININREGDITFEEFLSSQSINEILYNRGSHTIFYKLLSNHIKGINFSFKNNLVIHSDFFTHGDSDEYVKEYQSLLIPRKEKYETIHDEMKQGFDIHYSEQGHIEFANDVIKYILNYINLSTQKRNNLF